MAILVDWKIKSRSGICHHTEAEFADEEPFYTCIFNDPDSAGFIRKDYSMKAWKEISKELEPAPFSFWKSVYKQQINKAEQDAVKQNSAEAMLHRMIEEDQPATENARYILALMLERKKILIPTETKETETRTLLFYEHKDTGSVYIVADPKLHLEQVGEIQQEVSELLAKEEKRGRRPAASNDVIETPNEDGQNDGDNADQSGDQATNSKD